MDAFIEAFSAGVSAVDAFVWGWPLIVLLLGTHIYTTVRTRFIQRKIGTAIKLSVSKDDPSSAEGDISQFGALTTALAATIGTGNIVGVATGLLSGGPGAIFWMWVTGIFGIATKYAETYIGVKWRVKDENGKMIGGAMYALERGFKNKGLGKLLAVLFALFTAIASFGIGASVQSNSLAGAITATSLFDGESIPTWVIGLIAVIVISSFGVAGVGGGATFASLIVLGTMGLPIEIVGLMASVEPLIDMGRTALNVSDSMVAGVTSSNFTGGLDRDMYNDPAAVINADGIEKA